MRVEVRQDLRASLEDVWERWTTEKGLQGWWGPEDCVTTVRKVEAREGGGVEIGYVYGPVAAAPAREAEFAAAGVPVRFESRGSFTEFQPPRHLCWDQNVDYGPRSPPQPLRIVVDLTPLPGGQVRLAVVAEAAPSSHWAALAERNLQHQMERLASSLGD